MTWRVIVGSALWRTFGQGLDHLANLLLEGRKIPLYHRPDFPKINAEIVMNRYLADGRDHPS